MIQLEHLKKATERLTRWQRPSPEQLGELLRPGKVAAFQFKDDGITPNHPQWPF